MDTLTYGLSQQIGIYYKDISWRDRVFIDIMNHYPIDWYDNMGIVKTRDSCFLKLKDGTSIKFVKATNLARGYCFSKVIMQPGIDMDIVNCIIRPSLKHQNRDIMILKDNNDIE